MRTEQIRARVAILAVVAILLGGPPALATTTGVAPPASRGLHYEFTGLPANGNFMAPAYVAFSQDYVFVSDYGRNDVTVLRVVARGTPQYVRTIGTGTAGSASGQFNTPGQVAVIGNDLFVVDTYNHRVQRFDWPSGSWLSSFGTMGTALGQLDYPSGIAYNPTDGLLYVAELGTDRIQKFTTGGTSMGQVGSPGSGDGQIDDPYGLAIDRNGALYVADSANARVVRFGADGQWQRNFPTAAVFPYGVSIDPAGMLWVASGVNEVGRVQCFDPLGHELRSYSADSPRSGGTFGTVPNGYIENIRGVAVSPPLAALDGQSAVVVTDVKSAGYAMQFYTAAIAPLAHPALPVIGGLGSNLGGIAYDSNENIYVTSLSTNRIYKFDRYGTPLTQWGSAGTGNAQFNGPAGIAIDANDMIYVVDRNNHRVQKFTTNAVYSGQFGLLGSGNGLFNTPVGIAVDNQGFVYVTEQGNHRVQKLDSNGVYARKWGSFGAGSGQFNAPSGIAVDSSSGAIFVAEQSGNRIQRFTLYGDFVQVFGESIAGSGALAGPTGLVTDQHGNLYVADTGGNRVAQFNDHGNFLTSFPSTLALAVGVDPRSGRMHVGDGAGNLARFGATQGKADTIGVYRPSTRTFLLRVSNSAGPADLTATVTGADPQDLPVVGDWNGDGYDTPGLFRPATGTFYLWERWDALDLATADHSFVFGTSGDRPLAGDWNNDGIDTVAVFRPSLNQTLIRNRLTAGAADYTVSFGMAGDLAVAGDWDGDGGSALGVFRAGDGRVHAAGASLNGTAPEFGNYLAGTSGDLPVSGDWTRAGHSGLGVFRPSTATFLIKYNLDDSAADLAIPFGQNGDLPLAGTWRSLRDANDLFRDGFE